MMLHDHALRPLSDIRPTEEVCPDRVKEVVAMILETRAWTRPICIEGTIGALLDGHHRFAAARLLGLTRVPVHVFDYSRVYLTSWRPDFVPTRDEVLARALSGELYPYKTTRHVFATRLMRPIPMAELMVHCCEMQASADTTLGSSLLMQPPHAAEQPIQMRRRG